MAQPVPSALLGLVSLEADPDPNRKKSSTEVEYVNANLSGYTEGICGTCYLKMNASVHNLLRSTFNRKARWDSLHEV